jgi:hypothetical protein
LKYSGHLIPCCPQKNPLTKLNLETSDFMEGRRRNLESFIGKILAHEHLRKSYDVYMFMVESGKNFAIYKEESKQ